jgi:hypothetical protein
VYAHALYDVGHALRVLGQTSSAIAFLTQRMTINDQRQVVAAELKAAMHDVAKGRGNGGAKPGKQDGGNGGNSGNGQN